MDTAKTWRFQELEEQSIEVRQEREERARYNQAIRVYERRYTGQTPMLQFHPGEQVYATGHFLSKKRNHFNAGFAPRRTGSHTVLERIAGDVYILNQDGQVKKHGNQFYRQRITGVDYYRQRTHVTVDNRTMNEIAVTATEHQHVQQLARYCAAHNPHHCTTAATATEQRRVQQLAPNQAPQAPMYFAVTKFWIRSSNHEVR